MILKSAGQCLWHGSGNSNPSNTARHAASGRRAHHKCSVDGCPCRMDFSRAECSLTAAMGKSTSMRRLQEVGIMELWRCGGAVQRTEKGGAAACQLSGGG